MKKLLFCAAIAFVMSSFVPSTLMAAEKAKATTTANTKADVPTEAALAARLVEIKAMDKSSLSRSEKKELRSEVKSIKATQDEIYVTSHHHGVYYGVGSVLLIVLIVILIV